MRLPQCTWGAVPFFTPTSTARGSLPSMRMTTHEAPVMRHVLAFAALSQALLGLGCPPAKTPVTAAAAVTVPRPADTGDLPDPKDRCPEIPDGCAATREDDGCPEVVLQLGADCRIDPPSARTLTSIANGLNADPAMTAITIVSGKAQCLDVVLRALRANGVPAERLETAMVRSVGSTVRFHVAAWKGLRCE